MRAYSRDAQSSYYKYQSLPRNFTQEKRLKQLYTLKENQVKVGIYKYSTDDQLGNGYSSKVYKGVEIEKIHKRYAIKVIELKKFRGSNLQMLEAQIEIHKHLTHSNIVRLYEVIKTPQFYYIILEYCPHGNLHQYIRQKKKLTQNNAIEIMEQILAGSRHLMEQGVIHRDFKPMNILRNGNKWKISDFGFAVKSRYGFKDRINVGTPLYMSPQSLKKSYYSSKTDIYSLGVILYEMIEGKTPYDSSNEKQLFEKMKEEMVFPTTIKYLQTKQFIQRCCQLNQAKRMSRQELLQFKMLPPTQLGQQVQPESQKETSWSRAANASTRSSLMLSEIGSLQKIVSLQETNYTVQMEYLSRQFLLVKHLYSCIKNIDSFFISNDAKESLILILFKFLLKLVRFLSDKAKNNFNLNHWEDFICSKPYKQLYQTIVDTSELYEKQYLQQIKQYNIKMIRLVNRKFPELCHHSQLTEKFYQSMKQYLAVLIREHNHEIVLIVTADGQNKFSVNNVEPLKQQIIADQKIGSTTSIKLQRRPSKNEQIQNHIMQFVKAKTMEFPDNQQEAFSPLLMQTKRGSRLLIKRISKQQSFVSLSKANINGYLKMEEQKKQTKNQSTDLQMQQTQSQNEQKDVKLQKRQSEMQKRQSKNEQKEKIILNDKYQALESLYTIYRVAQLRCSHDEKDISLQRINVFDNFLESTLQKRDYLDLRRLLRSI